MTNEKNVIPDPFQKLHAALDNEELTSPAAKRTAFRQDPNGTID